MPEHDEPEQGEQLQLLQGGWLMYAKENNLFYKVNFMKHHTVMWFWCVPELPAMLARVR